jgi:hypothetical protein
MNVLPVNNSMMVLGANELINGVGGNHHCVEKSYGYSHWLLQRTNILRQNPNFTSAAVKYAFGIVRLFEGQYTENKVMANFARQIICLSIVALHFNEKSGKHRSLVTSIQRLTTSLEICSKNTTAATIDLLERVGFVTRTRDQRDHRLYLIQPTPRLMHNVRELVSVSVSAADELYPLRRYPDLLCSTDDFMERYFAASLHSLRNISSLIFHNSGLHIFDMRDSGAILLCKLMTMRCCEDDNVVSFPFEQVAQLYGVSRTHIRRLILNAESEGLLKIVEDGGQKILLRPALIDIFEHMVAAQIAKAQFDIHVANKDYDLLPAGHYSAL